MNGWLVGIVIFYIFVGEIERERERESWREKKVEIYIYTVYL
jgi:hypothetical protein